MRMALGCRFGHHPVPGRMGVEDTAHVAVSRIRIRRCRRHAHGMSACRRIGTPLAVWLRRKRSCAGTDRGKFRRHIPYRQGRRTCQVSFASRCNTAESRLEKGRKRHRKHSFARRTMEMRRLGIAAGNASRAVLSPHVLGQTGWTGSACRQTVRVVPQDGGDLRFPGRMCCDRSWMVS